MIRGVIAYSDWAMTQRALSSSVDATALTRILAVRSCSGRAWQTRTATARRAVLPEFASYTVPIASPSAGSRALHLDRGVHMRLNKFAVASLLVLALVALASLGLDRSPLGKRTVPTVEVGPGPERAETQLGMAATAILRETVMASGDGTKGDERTPGAEETIEVRVVDTEGVPVTRARVWSYGPVRSVGFGLTGSEGSCHVNAPPSGHIAVSAIGFREVEQQFEEDERLIVVHLDPEPSAAKLSGRLGFRDGSAVKGASALAWSRGRRLSVNEVRGLMAGVAPPRVALAEASADGSFTLEGLREGESYVVGGFEPGAFSVDLVAATPGISESLDVVLEYVYATRLRLTDSVGESLKTSKKLFGNGPFWSVANSSVTGLAGAESYIALCGLPVDEIDDRGYQSGLYLFRSDLRRESVGPVSYEIEVPGYAPISTELQAQRAHEAALQTLELLPIAEGWGRLEIERIDAIEGIVADSELVQPVLGVVYVSKGDENLYNFALPWTSTRSLVIDGVPYGEYKLLFQAKHTPWYYPELERHALSVGANTAKWTIDLRGSSALHLELVNTAGEGVQGPVRLRLLDVVHSGVSNILFHESETIVYPARPGSYEVNVSAVGTTRLDYSIRVPTELRPDEVTAERLIYDGE